MNWNRSYRPRRIADLHLTNVRQHFASLLKSGKFGQVFLFAGPKGTGKTSTARILAAVLNDPQNKKAVEAAFFDSTKKHSSFAEPDPKAEIVQRVFSGSSFMVQELDAASNRGIDDVRALKERVGLPPQDGVISVYILDEVHMLTTEAFNALLKLLEEPPPHVVFILATTEKDKIPATVISRAQAINFTKATVPELTQALLSIVTAEKLEYEAAVLEAIALQADGSFRDAVKLLEMIAQVGPVTAETAQQVLALSSQTQVHRLIDTLLEKDATQLVQIFQELRNQNVDQKQLYTQLLNTLHADLLKSYQVVAEPAAWPQRAVLFLLKELADPFTTTITPIPFLALELKFLEIIDRSQKKPGSDSAPSSGTGGSGAPAKTTVTATQKTKKAPSIKQTDSIASLTTASEPDVALSPHSKPEVIPTAAPAASTASDELSNLSAGDGALICEKWSDIVAQAVKHNFGLATLLRAAQPISGEQGKVTVSVYYTFHKEQLQQPKFKQQLDPLFAEFAGGRIELDCQLAEQPDSAELHEVTPQEDLAELAVASLM